MIERWTAEAPNVIRGLPFSKLCKWSKAGQTTASKVMIEDENVAIEVVIDH